MKKDTKNVHVCPGLQVVSGALKQQHNLKLTNLPLKSDGSDQPDTLIEPPGCP